MQCAYVTPLACHIFCVVHIVVLVLFSVVALRWPRAHVFYSASLLCLCHHTFCSYPCYTQPRKLSSYSTYNDHISAHNLPAPPPHPPKTKHHYMRRILRVWPAVNVSNLKLLPRYYMKMRSSCTVRCIFVLLRM